MCVCVCVWWLGMISGSYKDGEGICVCVCVCVCVVIGDDKWELQGGGGYVGGYVCGRWLGMISGSYKEGEGMCVCVCVWWLGTPHTVHSTVIHSASSAICARCMVKLGGSWSYREHVQFNIP